MSRVKNPMTLERFYETYTDPSEVRQEKLWGIWYPEIGSWVGSKRDNYSNFKWQVVAVGIKWSHDNPYVLLEMPSNVTAKEGAPYNQYWSYGYNENGINVVRRRMLVSSIVQLEKGAIMCQCRRGHCYCENESLTYEINEHSLTVDINRGYRTLRLTLDECAELVSFLATAKSKIKEAKLLAIKEQQDELSKQLKEVESL